MGTANAARMRPSEATRVAVRCLAVELRPDGSLPSEFRLFVAGWNESENGRFLFDGEAAKQVLAAYSEWGVDLAIDLEHQMLEPGIAPDPTAKDARGWCALELRADGSLWAVNVKWTADGAARLSERRQRYISPAFKVDPETSRVTAMINVAITAIPATHDTPALVAASKTIKRPSKRAALAALGASMSPDTIKQALEALIAGDTDKCAELLKQIVTEAAAGSEPAAEEPAPAEGAAEEMVENAAEVPAEKKEEVAAASARLMRITGKNTFLGVVDEVETWRKSHLALEAETAKLAREREALELGKRKENAIAFTTLGVETPATSGLATGKLCKRLLDEPLDEQNARLAMLTAARAKPAGGVATAPSESAADAGSKEFSTPHGPIVLSARELEGCVQAGAKPEVYAANKALQAKARKGAQE